MSLGKSLAPRIGRYIWPGLTSRVSHVCVAGMLCSTTAGVPPGLSFKEPCPCLHSLASRGVAVGVLRAGVPAAACAAFMLFDDHQQHLPHTAA